MALQEKIINDADKLQKAMILLAHANNEPIKGKIKLQKIMFLLSDNLDEIKKQSSYADNMPYSETVDKEMRYLNDAGVFIIDDSRIELSKEGKKIAKQLEKQEENLMKLLCNYKDFLNKLNTEEILTYIYAAYPNMAGKSAEYDKLKPHIVTIQSSRSKTSV